MSARTYWPPRRADIAPPESIETLGDTGPVPLDQQLVEMPVVLEPTQDGASIRRRCGGEQWFRPALDSAEGCAGDYDDPCPQHPLSPAERAVLIVIMVLTAAAVTTLVTAIVWSQQ